jgi:hypothetical protein
MGILDDAIRQHLDLKRRQGADATELQRLEDEAFGPPARPGDPDFPTDAEAEELGDLGSSPEEPATMLAEPEVEPAEPEGPAGLFDVESEAEPFAEPASEAPVVDDPALEEMPSAEVEAAGPETAEDFGLDEIDLELDEEPLEAEPVESEEIVEPELEPEPEPEALEPPVESLDTVEHQIEEVEPAEAEPAPEGPAPVPEPEEEEAAAEEGDGEDVLEETPEFLRDRPEDDELWFEQGEPKDFDF